MNSFKKLYQTASANVILCQKADIITASNEDDNLLEPDLD